MNWRQGALIFLMLAGCEEAKEPAYSPSLQQQRVDRSFSDIPIDTPFSQARGQLTEIRSGGCEGWKECEWRDRQGVRYYFWGDPEAYGVVVKTIWVADFAGRPIQALGIGPARKRDQVLAAAKEFEPDATWECMELEDNNPGPGEACTAFLGPGWATVAFDQHGSLTEVRIDGYHFT
jgi:hypothetical protein